MGAGKPRVYVIDDDRSFLAAVTRLIRTEGYDVEGMHTLAELINYLPLKHPCCLLVDIMLAGETGLHVKPMLAQRAENAPVLFMSATDNPDQIAEAHTVSGQSCLRKPFEAGELFSALSTALSAEAVAPRSTQYIGDSDEI